MKIYNKYFIYYFGLLVFLFLFIFPTNKKCIIFFPLSPAVYNYIIIMVVINSE